MTILTKSYSHIPVDLNKGKEDILLLLMREYRRVAKIILNKQLNHFYKTNYLSTKSKDFYGNIDTFLSERYKDVIKRQVDGILKSYFSNRKNEFVKIVYKSSLNESEKKVLLKINRAKTWVNSDNPLARKIYKNLFKKNNFPSTNKINLLLNTKVYKLEKNKTTKTCSYHIKLRTCLKENKEIIISLKDNTYFSDVLSNYSDNETLKINNSIQLNFNKDNLSLKNIVLSISYEPHNNYDSLTDKISIDFGLKNLFTLDNGNILGKGFQKRLIYYDNKLSFLTKELKVRDKYYKLKKNKRYNKLINCVKSFIKNEVNRLLNRIIKRFAPSEIVVESLDFSGSQLSKRMNRLLNNCGLSRIKDKLESIKLVYGIKITHINPAFTSQECSECYYISKENRKTRDNFKCKCCGKKLPADVNAARVGVRRSNDEYFTKNKYLTRNQVKQYIMKKHNIFCDRITSYTKVENQNDFPPKNIC